MSEDTKPGPAQTPGLRAVADTGRRLLLAVALIAAAVYGFWPASDEAPRETDHPRYIYGFHVSHSQRQFGEYLEPITADGLREIRWDKKPRAPVTVMASSSTSSTWSMVTTASTATGIITICGQPALAIQYVRY